jgi:hypothetical protein
LAIQRIDQETQIRSTFPVSDYNDAVAASEANFETNPTNLLDDLNNIRSQLHNLLQNQAGNWWDDLNTPSALDTGTQRGVNDLNTDLHALERKRVLVKAVSLADVAVGAAVAATETLTSAGAFSDTETVTIGSRTYTFRTPFVDAADNIDASGTVAQTHENLRRAINGDGVAGTNYGTGTVVHADVTASDTATTNVITAKKAGTAGNLIATTETGANISFGGATLSGGSGGDVVILGSGELPPNVIAAVGAVTTSGTVVQTLGSAFGTAQLDEVAGGNAIAPKNFVEVVDVTSRDPILSDGRVIYGLLQGEPGLADGDTILDAGSDRVQVTFVRINALGTDLETIDGADLGSNSVFLCFTERKALEDLTEQDFLRGAVTDVPASSTVTRQLGYDNQGATPVDLTTNATLDLEGAGLEWVIRDDLQANLFRILEGSAGGTSQVQLGADVDSFNVDAIDNDFANGVKIDTGSGSPIHVGVTDGHVETTAGDLHIQAAAEIFLDDLNQGGSTWAQTDGIKLSETTAEWNAFETAFGEVSLLNAIVQAAGAASSRRRVYAVATVAAAADADVSGPSNDNNLDADLGDLSGGTFVDDYDIYHNGQYQRLGASAAANFDVYPGTSLANGQLKFEKKLKIGDTICVVDLIP